MNCQGNGETICKFKSSWLVKWRAQGIKGCYLGSWERKLCDGCIEPWLKKIRPANDIHYIKI